MNALGAQELLRKMRLKHLGGSGRVPGPLTAGFSERHTVSMTVGEGSAQDVARSIYDHITKEQLLSLDNPIGVLG